MVFEVDNTTKRLLLELQESINGTIISFKNEQSEIKEDTERVINSLTDVATGLEIQNLKSSVTDSYKKIAQQLNELLESLEIEINEISKNAITLTQLQEITNLIELLKDNIELLSQSGDKAEQGLLRSIQELSANVSTGAEKICAEIKMDNEAKLQSLYITSETELESLKNHIAEIMTRNELVDILDRIVRLITSNHDVLVNEYLISIKRTLDIIQNSQDCNIETLADFKAKTDCDLEAISSQMTLISVLEKQNNENMWNIVKYLSLPGYKRFFKGLEVQNIENA